MNDELTRLAEVMRERAAEVPHHQQAPPTMLVRARRRVVRTAVVAAAAAVLVVIAVSAGVASLGAPRAHVPGQTPAPSTTDCIAADLRATASLQGAAGSVEGSIHLTNIGDRACTLQGRPTIWLATSAGRALTPAVQPGEPAWRVNDLPEPEGWPVVRLPPGSAASVRIRWSNACPQLSEPALWTVDLTGGRGAIDVVGAEVTASCLGTGEGSTLEVGPFEPRRG